MKVIGVTSTLFLYRLSRRMGDANLPNGTDQDFACAVELQTDAGLSGFALVRRDVRALCAELVRERLSGEDPRAASGLWQRLLEVRWRSGYAGLVNDALSALDIAMWDLKAKANDEPLWKTLGGSRPRVPAHASGADLCSSDDEIVKWYGSMARDFGFRAGKLKVGLDRASDVRRLGLMQHALRHASVEPSLMIDADECWSPKEAIRAVREIEDRFDLTWVEAPTRRWDFLGLERVSKAIRSAVCVGGTLATTGELLPHLHQRSVDILELSLESGGITSALQRADAAFAFELPVTLSECLGNVGAHLCGALPYCMSLEVLDAVPPTDVFSTDVIIKDGWAEVGDRAGNGLQLDRRALAKAAIEDVPGGFVSGNAA